MIANLPVLPDIVQQDSAVEQYGAMAKQIPITLMGWRCERCGHKWIPKSDIPPKTCSLCKSPYWDRPRRVKRRPVKGGGKD